MKHLTTYKMFESIGTMYHVSLYSNRNSIMDRGLVPGGGPTPWPEDEYPEGTYLFDNIVDARKYGFGNGDPFDIWEVKTGRYNVQDDPITRGAFFTRDKISANDIEVVETHLSDVANPIDEEDAYYSAMTSGKKTYTVYRGEQGKRKDTGSGVFFTDTKEVALYFANDNPKKVKTYTLKLSNPLVMSSDKVISFDDVSKRAAEHLDKDEMTSLKKFNNEAVNAGTRCYDSNGKSIPCEKRTAKEISIDTFSKWVFANTDYDGIVIDNIEEADDLAILSTTYIAKKMTQAK